MVRTFTVFQVMWLWFPHWEHHANILKFPKDSNCDVPEWLIQSYLCSVPSGVITVFPASKIKNKPEWWVGHVPNRKILNVLEILLIVHPFSKIGDTLGKCWEHSKCSQFSGFLDIYLQCSQSVPDFYQKGTLWAKFQAHSEFSSSEHVRFTVLAHF